MKLVVDRDAMLRNIQRAEEIVGKPAISLMFKEFYSHFYDERFSDYVCFGNDVKSPKRVTVNISNKDLSFGKVFPRCNVDYSQLERIYLPIDMGDEREGCGLSGIKSIANTLSNYKGKLWLMITSGCISDVAPTYQELHELWDSVGSLFSGLSVGGSYWLDRDLPHFVSEVRIGEYMLFGTIPYSGDVLLRGECALSVDADVLAYFPEREQILIDCGRELLDIENCKICDPNLHLVHSSCEYSVLGVDSHYPEGFQSVEIIPDYYSLIKLRYADTEYIG